VDAFIEAFRVVYFFDEYQETVTKLAANLIFMSNLQEVDVKISIDQFVMNLN
jgi:hypothetical protein